MSGAQAATTFLTVLGVFLVIVVVVVYGPDVTRWVTDNVVILP